jgi:mRNA interferase MazF
MPVKRFEIWLANLDPSFGTEAGKSRPVLVVQTDLLNEVHPSTLVCPLTTNVVKGSQILRVNIDKSVASLNEDSAIMIDQLRAIDNRRLLKRMGVVSSEIADKVKENLKIILDLDEP